MRSRLCCFCADCLRHLTTGRLRRLTRAPHVLRVALLFALSDSCAFALAQGPRRRLTRTYTLLCALACFYLDLLVHLPADTRPTSPAYSCAPAAARSALRCFCSDCLRHLTTGRLRRLTRAFLRQRVLCCSSLCADCFPYLTTGPRRRPTRAPPACVVFCFAVS